MFGLHICVYIYIYYVYMYVYIYIYINVYIITFHLMVSDCIQNDLNVLRENSLKIFPKQWIPVRKTTKASTSSTNPRWSPSDTDVLLNLLVAAINHSISWVIYSIWLVGKPPLWKIWKSIGMFIPNIWKNKIHVPKHQPGMVFFIPHDTETQMISAKLPALVEAHLALRWGRQDKPGSWQLPWPQRLKNWEIGKDAFQRFSGTVVSIRHWLFLWHVDGVQEC